MARVDNFISGRVGNVVYYRLGNTQFVRSIAARVKQSKATKLRSLNFGVASAAGRILRAHLQQVLLLPKDRGMQIRFSGAIAKWLQRVKVAEMPAAEQLPFVSDFSFSNEIDMASRCRIPLLVEQPTANLITIAMDAFIPTRDITAPAGTVAVKFTLGVAGCNLAKAILTGSKNITLHIDYNNDPVPARVISFPVPVLPGSLLVTAASMEYITGDGTVCSKPSFMPCSVIDARYTG